MQPFLLPTMLLLPLALAQAPFPIAFSAFAPAASSTISGEVQSYIDTVILNPGFTSFTAGCSSAVATMEPDLTSTIIDLGCDPEVLGGVFFLASATPGWYNALPTNLQSYVYSIAAVEASIYSGQNAGGQPAQTSSSVPAQTGSGSVTTGVQPTSTSAPSPSGSGSGKSSGSQRISGDLRITVVTGAALAAMMLGMLVL